MDRAKARYEQAKRVVDNIDALKAMDDRTFQARCRDEVTREDPVWQKLEVLIRENEIYGLSGDEGGAVGYAIHAQIGLGLRLMGEEEYVNLLNANSDELFWYCAEKYAQAKHVKSEAE